jgi:DNA-binding transcriptional LysR family regulator
MEYNLRDLKFFETVAELEHIGRAADALGRSQPAITKCILRLEEAVGSPLFSREGRGIRLTAVGALLLTRARQLLRHAGEVERELRDFSTGISGHVRIGGGLISADHVIPDICASVLEASVGVSFDIMIAPNVALREELREGRIDLLIGLIPEADTDFVTVGLVKDVVVPAARRTHPIFRKRRYDLGSVLRFPWALPNTTIPSRQWLDRAFSAQKLGLPQVHIETNSPPLLPRIIERSDLISFIPRRMISAEQSAGLREIPVLELTMQREFGVTYRKEGYLSPATQRTLDLLIAQGQRLFAAPKTS